MKEHIVCPIRSCKMSGQCVRYKRFQEAEANVESYETLNPKKLKPGEQGCEHRLVSQQWRMAYGFCNQYQTLPVSAARRSTTDTNGERIPSNRFFRNSCWRYSVRKAAIRRSDSIAISIRRFLSNLQIILFHINNDTQHVVAQVGRPLLFVVHAPVILVALLGPGLIITLCEIAVVLA